MRNRTETLGTPRRKAASRPSRRRKPVDSVRTLQPSAIHKAHELLTVAAFLIGADSRAVDTEDVAVKVNQLAPGRFTWRKYPEQINIEIVRAFLSDAKKKKYGAYLTGNGTNGWLLTNAGLQFAIQNVKLMQLPASLARRLTKAERHRRIKEQTRVASSDAFAKFTNGQASAITVSEAEAAFWLNEYIVGDARESKVSRIVNTLGDDPEVGEAVRFCAAIVLNKGTAS